MFSKDAKIEVKNKILILYIINKFNIPISNNFLTDFVMKEDLMEYFVLQQYLTELLDKKLLEYTENETKFYYLITEKGKEMIELFISDMNNFVISELDKKVNEEKSKIKLEKQVYADYKKISDTNYSVNLSVKEGDLDIISLSLSLVTNKQAKTACTSWRQNASKIYDQLLKELVTDEDE